MSLPPRFSRWFEGRGWAPRAHQLALLEAANARQDCLLIAPTGAGKTLAGFLPTLVDLEHGRGARGGNAGPPASVHTLYISPLKALAVDIARNLEAPIAEMGLPIRAETRTGDTPASRRDRQRRQPPDIMITTPEQVALMLASADSRAFFDGLVRIIVDELHALAPVKRGDLLALGIARLRAISPSVRATGLSATVRDPGELARWLTPQINGGEEARIVTADARLAARPIITMLESENRIPWAGHTADHAMAEIYAELKRHTLSLVFVNTRMQAEFVFQRLWDVNEDGLRIALHHGSLDVSQRRKVEAAMSAGGLDAVVCTATLDLGIDWGAVDLVLHVGAPKGASRLLQRIGRSNHRLDEPSRAILVPSNRFEVLECRAAIDAAYAGEQDAAITREGGLDVLAQHILGMAVSEPFAADALFAEIRSAAPYAGLSREDFDRLVDFAATGGYALKSYDRFAKLKQTADGLWRVANGLIAQAYRMNIGTIVEAAMLKVHLGRSRAAGGGTRGAPGAAAPPLRYGPAIGEIEEGFAETLVSGDTFVFGGEVLRFEGIAEDKVIASRATGADPKIPSYAGGKFPLSTHLARRVRRMLADETDWADLPAQVRDWLGLQGERSLLPHADDLLIETFPRGGRTFLVAYSFEGRLAHQTLGMLLTRRLERARLRPLGFVCNDYALSVWMTGDVQVAAAHSARLFADLFDADMLGDDLEAWLAESALMKRSFAHCAIIAGMIERRFPGVEKRRRQMTMSTDLVYDVLRRHEPDHILLKAARRDAASGLLDLDRLAAMLLRIRGRIVHKPLERVSPLAVPILLEIGRERVYGEAADAGLEEAALVLMEEATA